MKTLTEYLKGNLGMIEPRDYTEMTEESIVELFHAKMITNHKRGKSMTEQFYVGITCDIESNLARHHISSYLLCARVKSYNVASNIERQLHDKYNVFIGEGGSSSAGNGGNDGADGEAESNIVYLAKRDEDGFVD